MAVSSVGETEKLQRTSQVSKDVSCVVFGNKFFGEKESVRPCIVVLQQAVLLSPMFRSLSSHIFIELP
jgi:hypothetical protein